MSRKNPNGKVVLYTENGALIATADVSNVIGTWEIRPDNTIHFNRGTFDIPEGARYFVVAAAKTVANEYPLQPMPFIIDEALKYTKTKFFRLIIDFAKLAQFDPFNGGIMFGCQRFYKLKNLFAPLDFDIDFSVSVPEIDAQLYKKYDFTPAMIDFVERKYSYDDGAGLVEG